MKFTTVSVFAFLTTIFLSSGDVSPEHLRATESKEIFFKKQVDYLLKDGGVWEAINPQFDKNVKYSAKTFKYIWKKGLHGENLQLSIESDINGIGWYTSWKGYYLWHPLRKEIIYHSLSGNGALADGVITAPDEHTRVNVFRVMSYEGQYTDHKDVTKQIADNEMHSNSYKLNAMGDWVFDQKFIWKRVKL